MKERSFDEMIAFFNRRVADMDISQDCKMELLGMVTALGYKHEKSVPQWIPCSKRLPDEKKEVLISAENGLYIAELEIINGREYWSEVMEYRYIENVEAWMPLPESYLGETESRDYENKGDDDYGKQ